MFTCFISIIPFVFILFVLLFLSVFSFGTSADPVPKIQFPRIQIGSSVPLRLALSSDALLLPYTPHLAPPTSTTEEGAMIHLRWCDMGEEDIVMEVRFILRDKEAGVRVLALLFESGTISCCTVDLLGRFLKQID